MVKGSLVRKAVKVVWTINIKVSMTSTIDGLVVHHQGTDRVLQDGVGGEDGGG